MRAPIAIFIGILTSIFLYANLHAQIGDAFNKKTLPSVEIERMDGTKVNINEFGKNGKITIINFWATWCGPCKQELSNIADLYEYWQEDYNAEVVAVSIDDSRNKAKVKSYVNAQGWDYIVLLDSNQDLKRALNFQSPPFTVVVDQNGFIVHTHTGYRPGDENLLEDELKELSAEK